MLYWEVLKFRFQRFFTYPVEIAASAAKRLIELLFLIFFWRLIINSSPEVADFTKIVSYLMIATGLADITMAKWGPLGNYLGADIRTGELSKILIKPVSIIPYLYFSAIGRNAVRLFASCVYMVVGIVIAPPESLTAVLLFVPFFMAAFAIALAYNVVVGSLAFYFTDSSGIRNSIEHMSRIFSGSIIPLYLYPDAFRRVLEYTPFPWMVYGPVRALQTNSFSQEAVTNLAVALMWGLLACIFAIWFWRFSIKKYEAVGI